MTALDWYGFAALVLVFLIFYAVRRILLYLVACLVVVAAFAFVARAELATATASWLVSTLGLLLFTFGLMIVRVMLIRSVSLHLLRRVQASEKDEFAEDIGGRLHDMRKFGLVRGTSEAAELSNFGRFVSGVVGVFYALFRIKT
jgi:hypothetical protein